MLRSRSLVPLLLLAGCSRPATSLSLALSTDARTPTELDELHLRVERASVTTMERTWALPREAQLPGSLTLVPDDGRDAHEPVLIVAAGYKDGVRRVERRARLAFSDEKRKVLRLRLSYACFDVVCSPDLTCDEGRCVSPDVDVDTLPDEDAVATDGVPAGACFDERACFTGASPVALSGCSFAAPGPKGSFNLYATWAAAPDRAALVGPSAYDVAGVSGTLGEILCQAAKKKSLLALHAAPVTSACKAATTELVCGDPPTIAGVGGGAGAAGSGGAGGAGQGGAGQGGIDGGGAGGGGQAGAGAGSGGAGAGGASGAAGGTSGAGGASGAGAGGTSGAGGVTGAGGTSGAGGAAGTGGASGAGGVAGTGGASGAGTGGASGAGGVAGTGGASGAGTGGASGAGTGGASGAGAGGAGAAGAAGASGSAGASGAGAGGATGAVAATIAVASAAACAVVPSGVACWGNDNMDQLAVPAPPGQVDLLVPQTVPGTAGATSVAMAANHTCAIVAGQVTCWGSNGDAESTGDGVTSFTTPPTVVTPAVEVVALDAATCARDAAGSVSCWGRADDGRLGVPGTGAKGITSVGIGDAVALGAGGASVACALRPALVGVGNRVTCWGNGVLAPTDIGGLDRAVEVRVGALGDVFVRRDDGTVVTSHASAGAWSAFAGVALPGVATALSADWHLCFASADGQVRCGILGYTASNASVGAWFSIDVPQGGVSELAGGNAIQYGRGSRCARATLGGVHCFGDDRSGQLGAGRLEDELSPALVAGTASLARIDLGNFGTVAVTSGGAPLFWGSSPALGASLDSIVTTPTTPAGVPTPTTFVRMGVDDNLAYALSGGQLSLFEQGVIKPATRVGGYGPATTLAFQDVYIGAEYDAALATVDGTAKVVFYASSGALNAAQEGVFGNGGVLPATYSSLGLASPALLTSFPQMAYTPGHLCAVAGTTLQCWGGNSNAQSGVVGGLPVLTPNPISLPSVTAACAGYAHTCAISGGKVFCWGRNFEGQVGVSGASAFSDPTEIAGSLTGFTGLACGHSHTCAWTLSGQLHCWGINHYGQLGIGDRAVHVGPQLVTSLSGVTYVGAAEEHTCAIASGQAHCWGLGYGGKLGNQKTGVETVAQAVVLP